MCVNNDMIITFAYRLERGWKTDKERKTRKVYAMTYIEKKKEGGRERESEI